MSKLLSLRFFIRKMGRIIICVFIYEMMYVKSQVLFLKCQLFFFLLLLLLLLVIKYVNSAMRVIRSAVGKRGDFTEEVTMDLDL